MAAAISVPASPREGVVITLGTVLTHVGFNGSPSNAMNYRVQAYVSEI